MTPETDQLVWATSALGLDPATSDDRGQEPSNRHSLWTRAAILREEVRDTIALRRGTSPISALVIAAGDGLLARAILDWGVDRVVGIDERAELVAAASEPARKGLELHRVESIVGPSPAEIGSFEIVVLTDDAAGLCPDRADLIGLARGCAATVCAIESRDRLADRDLAREAGFERVSLAEPPTDSERSWIVRERSLLFARVVEGRREA